MSPFKMFRPLQQGEFILYFVDPSAGGADNTAGHGLSNKWLDVPLILHTPLTITAVTPMIHNELTRIYKETGVRPVVAFERNNGGGFEMERLGRLNRNGDYRIFTMKALDPTGRLIDTGKMGWDTNTATRPKMLQELKEAIEGRMIHLYHEPTVNEMFSFIVSATGKPEAEAGAHDDLVMALAGVWQLYQTEQPESDMSGGAVVETIPANGMYKEAGVLYAEANDEF